MWSGAKHFCIVRTFSVARREDLLCGQTRRPSMWPGKGPFCVVRHEALLCGQARGPSQWSGAMPSMWLNAGDFTVVRHGALLYGQVVSVRPGAGTFFVARREDLLVARCVDFLCGQARGPSMWPGKGPFCVVRREALLCGQGRGLSMWPGARPFSVVRRGDPLVVRCKPCREMRGCITLKQKCWQFYYFHQNIVFFVVVN